METIKVTVWNENLHEQQDAAVRAIYPRGIHGAIAEGLEPCGRFAVRCATMDMPECGLTEQLLADTDVLIWWSHKANRQLPDQLAERVRQRVLEGMGFIVLHAAQQCKPFLSLMGTSCRVKWRENDEREVLWVIDPAHPITAGLPERIDIPAEETYGEPFGIPTPDETVFVGWFAGGEVFRSGCCFHRGRGKIFYFQPGHETYPIYYRPDIRQILANAVCWAAPSGGPIPVIGHYPGNPG